MNVFTALFGKPFLKLLNPLFSEGEGDTDFELKVKLSCEMISIEEKRICTKGITKSNVVQIHLPLTND